MSWTLAGLLLALGGPLLLLAAARRAGIDTLSQPMRLTLWAILVAVLAIMLLGERRPPLSIGLARPDLGTLAWGLGAGVAMLLLFGGLQRFGRATMDARDAAAAQRLLARGPGARAFIVLTAAVVEEVLFRGYGISRAGELLGSTLAGAALSTAAFALSHFSWSVAHILRTALAGALLAALFIHTADLLACVLAHLLVDAISFLLLPAMLARRQAAGTAPGPSSNAHGTPR